MFAGLPYVPLAPALRPGLFLADYLCGPLAIACGVCAIITEISSRFRRSVVTLRPLNRSGEHLDRRREPSAQALVAAVCQDNAGRAGPVILRFGKRRLRWRLSGARLTRRFSLLKHRAGEITPTDLDLDTYCVSEYKTK